MKVSKLIVPMMALTLVSNSNYRVAASCEDTCHEVFHHCIDMCTAYSIFALGCYGGCGIAWTTCMGICAAMR